MFLNLIWRRLRCWRRQVATSMTSSLFLEQQIRLICQLGRMNMASRQIVILCTLYYLVTCVVFLNFFILLYTVYLQVLISQGLIKRNMGRKKRPLKWDRCVQFYHNEGSFLKGLEFCQNGNWLYWFMVSKRLAYFFFQTRPFLFFIPNFILLDKESC